MRKLLLLLVLCALALPALATAGARPVVCGGPCDGGGYECNVYHVGERNPITGQFCYAVALPGWPYVGYRWL